MSDIFTNKKVNFQKLLKFGFKKTDDGFCYSIYLLNKQFKLDIKITSTGKLHTKLFECETNDEYTLHLVQNATGTFVGKIKDEYDYVIKKIVDACFDNNIFKSEYAQRIIEYAQKKYNDEFEYLWEKFSNNAICRRKDNSKWYMLLLTVKKSKLGFESQEEIEIIDLRETPEEISLLVDNKKYFPGYHMNKKHWLTIILDGSVSMKEIEKRIDKSYILAKKK